MRRYQDSHGGVLQCMSSLDYLEAWRLIALVTSPQLDTDRDGWIQMYVLAVFISALLLVCCLGVHAPMAADLRPVRVMSRCGSDVTHSPRCSLAKTVVARFDSHFPNQLSKRPKTHCGFSLRSNYDQFMQTVLSLP
jgi:hypothetical protein